MDPKSVKYLSGYITVTDKLKEKIENMPDDTILILKSAHGILTGRIFAQTGVIILDIREQKPEKYCMAE